MVTNGRVTPCIHHVRTPRNRDCLSVLFRWWGKDGVLLGAMEELVDEDHPAAYRACTSNKCRRFWHSDGCRLGDPLKAFCGRGVDKDDAFPMLE